MQHQYLLLHFTAIYVCWNTEFIADIWQNGTYQIF